MPGTERKRRSSAARDRIEERFEQWGRFAFRHAGWVILLVVSGSLAISSFIPTLVIDNSMEAFLHPNDPTRVAYDRFREEFGRDERMMVSIETSDVFAPAFLERLRDFHSDLEREVPHVDDLTSLINARETRGEDDSLVVGELMEEWPESQAEFEALRARTLANPLFRNSLVTVDGKVTVVSIRLVAFADDGSGDAFEAGFEDLEPDTDNLDYLPQTEIDRAVLVAQDVVRRYEGEDFRILMGGAPVMAGTLNRQMAMDMGVFTGLALVAIAFFLFVLFRRIAAVVLPLSIVILSMMATLGVMALDGTTISVGTQILPSFLLCVGVCDAVHVLAIYYQRIGAGDGREDAVAFTMGHSGLAIVMTSLTTMGGLGSFAAADLKPVADLGIYAPVGVLFALVFTVALMPALLAVIPARPPRVRTDAPDRITRALQAMGDFSAMHPWGVVSVAAAIVVVSLAGTNFLRISHDPIDWFPPGDPFRESTRFLDERLDGVNTVEVLVHSPAENGLYEPDLLNRVEELHRRNARTFDGEWHIAKTLSVNDVLKETHQALNENRSDYYTIPQDRELIAQELLLFENSGSDDLTDFVDPQFRTARVSMRVPWMDAIEFPPRLVEMSGELEEIFGDTATIEITGLIPLMSKTFLAVFESMGRSYALAIVVIGPLMILLIGNLWRGLLSMIPNLTPVIVMLGFMGWCDIPIDGLTMMVGAIVLGLAVDDTIHFMHNFRRYYERTGDARLAIHQTLETTGRALLVTSLVLSAGFFTYLGAYLTNIKLFGALAGGAILVAFFANVILASSLMVLATRRRT